MFPLAWGVGNPDDGGIFRVLLLECIHKIYFHFKCDQLILPRPDKVLPQVTIWPMPKVMAQACYLHNLCVLLEITRSSKVQSLCHPRHKRSDEGEVPLATSKIIMFKLKSHPKRFPKISLCSFLILLYLTFAHISYLPTAKSFLPLWNLIFALAFQIRYLTWLLKLDICLGF